MSGKLRIGELLLLQEKIDPWVLSHTLTEQAATQQRLVSLLVSRALLALDEGALVLSEQLGYPAALERHLERRDPSVLELLPPQLGSRWVVLPLARSRTGSIVVVARDPTPILAAALGHAMRSEVVLAVTPSVQLERMVRAAYGLAGGDEAPLPSTPPTLLDIGEVAVESIASPGSAGARTSAAGVAESAVESIEDETPLPIRRARTVSYMFKGPPDLLRTQAADGPIEATLIEIDRAITAAAVERLVMAYAAKRWSAALLARIEGALAIGLRGHGGTVGHAAGVEIALDPPSLISLAATTRRVITDAPASAALVSVLGAPTAAAPVLASGEVVAVLAVGAIIDGNVQDAVAELDRLVDALGAAYDRFSR